MLQGAPPVPQGARLLEDTGAASLPPGGAEACSGRRGGGTGHFCPLGIAVLRIWLRPSPEAWGQEGEEAHRAAKASAALPPLPWMEGGGPVSQALWEAGQGRANRKLSLRPGARALWGMSWGTTAWLQRKHPESA